MDDYIEYYEEYPTIEPKPLPKPRATARCGKHGDYEVDPSRRKNGRKTFCPECTAEKVAKKNAQKEKELAKKEATRAERRAKGHKVAYSQEEAIAKFKATHGDTYDYSLVEYKNTVERVIIVCPVHGKFDQIARNHWDGCGCPSCTTSFKSNAPAILYYIRIDRYGQTAYKIGITNRTLEERFAPSGDFTNITVLRTWEYSTGAEARAVEAELHRDYKDSRYTLMRLLNTDGNTELYKVDVLGLDPQI